MKDPTIPFYAQDFLVDTIQMPEHLIGAYIRLLCVLWVNGKCHNSAMALAMISPSAKEVVELYKDKFIFYDDGTFSNKRLEEERAKRLENREKKQKAGLKGASSRWQNDGKGYGKTMAKEKENENEKENEFKEEEERNYFEPHFHQMLPPEHLSTWRKYIDHQTENGIKITRHNVVSHLKAFKECWQAGISPSELLEAFFQSANQGLYYICKNLIKEKEEQNGIIKSSTNKNSVQSRLNYKFDEDKARIRLAELEEQFDKRS